MSEIIISRNLLSSRKLHFESAEFTEGKRLSLLSNQTNFVSSIKKLTKSIQLWELETILSLIDCFNTNGDSDYFSRYISFSSNNHWRLNFEFFKPNLIIDNGYGFLLTDKTLYQSFPMWNQSFRRKNSSILSISKEISAQKNIYSEIIKENAHHLL